MALPIGRFGPPWAMRGRDTQDTGFAATVGPEDPGVLGSPWPFIANGPIHSAPAIDYRGTAFFGANDGLLYSVDFTGRGGPIYDTQGAVWTTPALVYDENSVSEDGQAFAPVAIYTASDSGQLHCTRADGTPLWSLAPGFTPTGLPLRSSPVARRDHSPLSRVYLGSDDGHVFAVFESDPTTASTAWEATIPGQVRTSPVLSPQGNLLYVAASDGALYCFDAKTGVPLPGSPVQLSAGSSLSTPAVSAKGEVFVADLSGTLYALDATGKTLWQTIVGSLAPAGPALGLDEVFIVADHQLVAVSRSGSILWKEALPPKIIEPPIVDSAGTCYVSNNQGQVVGVNRDPTAGSTRIAWQLTVAQGQRLSSPALDAFGRVYVGGQNSRLYVLDETPAFKMLIQSDLFSAANLDVYSLRESYGVLDPARTLRLTDNSTADRQPATSLDRRIIGFVSARTGADDAFLANARGGQVQNLTATGPVFSAATLEADPAFTAIDDLTGAPKPPNNGQWMATTSGVSGTRRLLFVNLSAPVGAGNQTLTFSDWATNLGVPTGLTSSLEPPSTTQSHAAFSPDGRKLAWRHCDLRTNQGSVRLLSFSSGGWNLTSLGPLYILDPEQKNPCRDEPCFAPDSRWIAVRDTLSLAIYDVLGIQAAIFSVPSILGAIPTHPSWSPDGTEIAVGLSTGSSTDIFIASGPAYSTYTALTRTLTSDEPAYDYFKMPAPRGLRVSPDRQTPEASVQIQGRGFDILYPENNAVFFTDTLRGTPRRGLVLSARVDPKLGLGVLTVRVPQLAGHGPIRVVTRYGEASTQDFHVLPAPSRVEQPRSVPGALIRVFGTGFDLTPPNQHTVTFTDQQTGATASSTAQGGAIAGDAEYLVVKVPTGIGLSSVVSVVNGFGSGAAPQPFTKLVPRCRLVRTVDSALPDTGLPAYASQGAEGTPVRVVGQDFPRDVFFGVGTSTVDVSVTPVGGSTTPVMIRSAPFVSTGSDTASFGPTVFPFPNLGPAHPGGPLDVRAQDSALPAAFATTGFRVPLTNIPIIFVPGTSGTSLDLSVPTLSLPFAGDVHTFPWLSKTLPMGRLLHPPVPPLTINPARLMPAGDPRAPRVWFGPEALAYLLGFTPFGNAGNHYLDLVAFTPAGTPATPAIVPGTVLRDVVLATSPGGSMVTTPVYEPLVSFLTTPGPTGWPGRPLCTAPPGGACINSTGTVVSGNNAVYLFNLDWRDSIPTQAARLDTFINAVLGRPDVTANQVVLITHSYGGPVARGYYLNPAFSAATKVDQVISVGGGFLGVPLPFDILERGSTWGYGLRYPFNLGLADWETQALAQNWPTAYFQMPNSEDWFFDHNLPVGLGIANRSYVRDHRWPIGAGEIASYSASQLWVGSRHTPGLAAAQTAFFNPPGGSGLGMGDFRTGTGAIYHHRIIGKGRPDTVVGTTVYLGPSEAAALSFGLNPIEAFPTEHRRAVHGDGDSTVPYHGALGRTDPRDDRIYILDGVEHLRLINCPEMLGTSGPPPARGLLQLLLEGRVGAQPQAPIPFLSHNAVIEINPGGSVAPVAAAFQPAANSEQTVPDRFFVEVRGLVELEIEDQRGGRLGSPTNRDVSELVGRTIEDATYTPGALATTALLTQPGTYLMTVRAISDTAAQMTIRPYDAQRAYVASMFRSISMPRGSIATLTLSTGDPSLLELVLHAHNSNEEVRINPEQLDPIVMEDTAPPRTRLRVSDGLVHVEASDAGAGVHRTYYTTDGLTRSVYEGPFEIPDDALILMAYSEDRAGNLEYPGAVAPVLGLSEHHIALSVPARTGTPRMGSLDVRNLDPLSITGDLECIVDTDHPWLTVTPREATTPFKLEISVDADMLDVGRHEARVIVHATTTSTVRADQEISVSVTVG